MSDDDQARVLALLGRHARNATPFQILESGLRYWFDGDDACVGYVDTESAPATGAIPKDGPSAGIAMATAMVSALSGRAARHDVAMTGEIALSGRVLPIGGLKEKILDGVRAGIREFVIPRENEPDLDDLPQDVRDQIHVKPVDTLAEALSLTLRNTLLRDGRLYFDGQMLERPTITH